jgi:hypothetical protein
MPLSPRTPINETDIAGVRSLKFRKVFLLDGWEDDQLVIKTDTLGIEGIGRHVKPTVHVMRSVDRSSAKLKALDPMEIRELKSFATYMKDRFHKNPNSPLLAGNSLDAINQLDTSLSGPNTNVLWVKMEKHDLTDLDAALELRKTGDKSGLKRFRERLKAPNGLEKLGEIMAADLFTGNQDRINLAQVGESGSKFTMSNTQTLDFQVIQNPGNLFLRMEDGRWEVAGLDFVDLNSPWFKFLEKPLAEVEEMYMTSFGSWPGRFLQRGNEVALKMLAEKTIQDLQLALSPNRKKFFFAILGIGAERRLLAGLKSGTKKIYQHMRMKYAMNPNAPRGILDRLAVIESAAVR